MPPKAPPSFSSFPHSSKPDRQPPSFASFPAAASSNTRRPDTPPDAAHSDADSFLRRLQGQIEGSDLSKHRQRAASHSSTAQQQQSSKPEHDSHSYAHRHSSRRDKDRNSDTQDRSRRSKRPREHSADSSSGKDIWNELRQDSKSFGQQQGKSYQLVQYETSKSSNNAKPDVPKAETSVAWSTPTQDSDKPYYSDKRGDELNVRYGSLHRGDVPKYRRIGAGRVLGLNDGLRITKETAYSGRGIEIAPARVYQTPRYTDPRAARHITNKHLKTVRIRAKPTAPLRPVLGEAVDINQLLNHQDPFTAESADPSRFVRFEPEQSFEDTVAALEHEQGQDYRSVAGKVKPEDLENDNAVSEDEDDGDFAGLGLSGGESLHEYFKRRNEECDRAVREHPKDAGKWIEFADLQDEIARNMFLGTSTKRAFSKAERASTSEIKLSILERALAVQGNEASEKLLLAHIKAASDLWDPARVLQRWSSMLRTHPNLTGLWIEYVSWRQTTASGFSVRAIVDVFAECFEVLSAAMDKQQFRSQKREELEANCLYLFLRLCIMLRQAGFSERATAAFQAILELNLFRPNQFVQPPLDRSESAWRGEVLDALEGFWDTEAARIGEEGARGWRATSDQAQAYTGKADERDSADVGQVEGLSRCAQWARAEQTESTKHRKPGRTTDVDSEDSDDPYHVVLFDDIRNLLFLVHSPDSKMQLAYSFLNYLGLPFIPPDVPTDTPFTTDTFIHSELVERQSLAKRFLPPMDLTRKRFEVISGEPMESERRSVLSAPYDTPFHSVPASVDLLFGTRRGWFATLRPQDLEDVDVDMARNSLQMLRTAVSDNFLTLDYFAFEACQNPKNAVKVAKQVLKDSRQNLVLWDGYARLERQRGKLNESRQVYVTALSMYRSFKPNDQVDGPLLWRAWAEMEWEEGDTSLALHIVVAMVTQVQDLANLVKEQSAPPSAAQMLRTRQALSFELEKAFQPNATQALVRNRNHYAFCASLVEYLSRGLEAATEVMERHIFRLENSQASGSAEHEEALMSLVKLAYRHSTAGKGFKPGDVRQVTERAISSFKHNTLALSTFYFNERKFILVCGGKDT
ncbi:hypothetical protein ACM66B_000655 [Microbotryomycetes sp. NB124-2]